MPLSNDERRFLRQLGHALRNVRESKGWTLEECEEHGWINWRHLQQIESGKNITVISLRRLAKLYRISTDKLLAGVE